MTYNALSVHGAVAALTNRNSYIKEDLAVRVKPRQPKKARQLFKKRELQPHQNEKAPERAFKIVSVNDLDQLCAEVAANYSGGCQCQDGAPFDIVLFVMFPASHQRRGNDHGQGSAHGLLEVAYRRAKQKHH